MSKFVLALKTCIKDKYFITGTRASREEFWYFASVAISLFLAVHFLINLFPNFGIFINLINFIIFIGLYSATVRRLHDSNRSAKHLLPILFGMAITIAGIIVNNPMLRLGGEIVSILSLLYVLVLCALKGDEGDNNYGSPCPLKN